MAKLSAQTRNALSIVAHAAMAREIDKNVFQKNGQIGFYNYWLKQQTAANRAIIQEFEKMAREAYAEMARLMKDEAKP